MIIKYYKKDKILYKVISKKIFANQLINIIKDIIDNIWSSELNITYEVTKKFIKKIIKSMKISYYTVQVSLFYLFKIKNIIINSNYKCHFTKNERIVMKYGRFIFFASLIIASIYLKNPIKDTIFSEITNLSINNIIYIKELFLKLLDDNLDINKKTFLYFNFIIESHIYNKIFINTSKI